VPAAAVMALVAWLVAAGVAALVDTDLVVWRLVQVGLAVAAGLGVYLMTALMSGIEEVDEVVGAVRRRFH
jgi:hypothetical protein